MCFELERSDEPRLTILRSSTGMSAGATAESLLPISVVTCDARARRVRPSDGGLMHTIELIEHDLQEQNVRALVFPMYPFTQPY